MRLSRCSGNKQSEYEARAYARGTGNAHAPPREESVRGSTVPPERNGEPAGTRTQDPVIKSHVLYRLSYGLSARGGGARPREARNIGCGRWRINAVAAGARCAASCFSTDCSRRIATVGSTGPRASMLLLVALRSGGHSGGRYDRPWAADRAFGILVWMAGEIPNFPPSACGQAPSMAQVTPAGAILGHGGGGRNGRRDPAHRAASADRQTDQRARVSPAASPAWCVDQGCGCRPP